MLRRYLIVFAGALALVGCASTSVQSRPCLEPEVQIKTNADMARAVLELQSAIRLCNALSAEE